MILAFPPRQPSLWEESIPRLGGVHIGPPILIRVTKRGTLYRALSRRNGETEALHAPRIQLTSANDETRPTAVGGSATDNAAFFRGDDDYWSISYHDTVLRLRDAKGLRYIARLLHNPGVGFAARELMRIAATPTVGVGESAFEAAPKRDEQARLGMTKRIKAVIKRIEVEHPLLAYHLSVSIKTGAYCVYRPDPARPVVWR